MIAVVTACARPIPPPSSDVRGPAELDALVNTVEALAHQPVGSGRGRLVADLARERGLEPRFEPVDWWSTQRNVVIDLPGRRPEVVYLVAHHDRTDANWFALASILANGLLHDVVSPTFMSRGALDNGTGVAVVLELATWLARRDRELSWRVLFTGSEEVGLRGSRAHVSRLAPEAWDRVLLAVNVDTVGASFTGNCLMTGITNDALVDQVVEAAQAEGVPLGRGRIPPIASTDHAAFARAGPLIDVGRGLMFNAPGGLLPQRSWFTPRVRAEDGRRPRRAPVLVMSGCSDLLGPLDWLSALLVIPTGHLHGPRDNTQAVDAERLWEAWAALRAWVAQADTPEGADRLAEGL